MSTAQGTPRSDATKARILAAARDQFAQSGYERATIRSIAAAAEIDPSMVMRYFGNKENLFAIAARLELELPDLTTVAPESAGAVLVTHFLDRWDNDEVLLAVLRRAATNAEVSMRIRQAFSTQLLPTVRAFTISDSEAADRAGLIASQMLGMALCRYVLGFPPVVNMSNDRIIAWLGPTLQRYLAASGPEA